MAAARLSSRWILPAKKAIFCRLIASGSRLCSGGGSLIPPFVEKNDEPVEVKRNRLQYQSRKRGMLENCILLGTFAEKHLPRLDEEQMAMYDRLINLPSNDWDIYHWATGKKETPAEFDNVVMDLLKAHIKNRDEDPRRHSSSFRDSC